VGKAQFGNRPAQVISLTGGLAAKPRSEVAQQRTCRVSTVQGSSLIRFDLFDGAPGVLVGRCSFLLTAWFVLKLVVACSTDVFRAAQVVEATVAGSMAVLVLLRVGLVETRCC